MISLAEKLNAETSTFYFDSGFDKGNKGDYYGAISDFTKALEINSSVGAYYNRGWNKAKLKDYYGAISDYSKAIKINPNKEEAYLNRGFAKHNLKDYYGAVSDYTKAIEINPSYALGFSNRGSSKELIGDMQGACSDWQHLLEMKALLNESKSMLKIKICISNYLFQSNKNLWVFNEFTLEFCSEKVV